MDLTYLTLAGRSQLEMLRWSLYSLALSWPMRPRIVVVSDGSIASADVDAAIGAERGVQVMDWRGFLGSVDAEIRTHLATFAARAPMARKIAPFVALAKEGPVLYADTDVLWFAQPRLLREWLGRPSYLVMSEDEAAAYDPSIMPSELPELAEPPYRCAGVMLGMGPLATDRAAQSILTFAAAQGVDRTEQTLFAELARRAAMPVWPRSEILLATDDAASLWERKCRRAIAARHYVGAVRHLFWRDALWLWWQAVVLRRRMGRTQE